MLYIGIDPGKGGGIAIVSAVGPAEAIKMPATDTDIYNYIRWAIAAGQDCEAVIERVSSSPQMGVVSAFTFGKGYGALRMALTAAAIPYREVAPAVWQRSLGCLSRGDKNVTKARAQALFPSVKVTHAIADALLLAEYCRLISGKVREKVAG